MVWLPDGEKNVNMFIRFMTDTQMDRQTDTARRHRPRLHSIARQKLKQNAFLYPYLAQICTL